MEFKDELKRKRTELGLTQKEMAEKLQISFSAYNRLEKGHSLPRKNTLETRGNECFIDERKRCRKRCR